MASKLDTTSATAFSLDRFPENAEIAEAQSNTETVVGEAYKTIDRLQKSQNSLFGRLKRMLFGR